MSGNIFGKSITLKTFGESHGIAIGGILDGIPPGILISEEELQREMDRRRPGQSRITTSRNEKDQVQILSGTYKGKTTGMPIGLLIKNTDARSRDYSEIAKSFRPSHADYTYSTKYGMRDPAGGGRSSARETAIWVAAAYFVKKLLSLKDIRIRAYVSSIADVELDRNYSILEDINAAENIVRCPDSSVAEKMIALIEEARTEGDTLGGCITCEVLNCPPGLGEPVFDKLNADLAKAMLSINACKGFEMGSGFASTQMKGSEHNDPFEKDEKGKIFTKTNHSGGVQGGISNGMPLKFRLAFKPVSTILKPQQTIDTEGHATELMAKGRHDPCVLPRAVPIVEAMAALVIGDHWMRWNALDKAKEFIEGND